jgi:acyl-CoA reductase-like NAD-dependent aldehyde dehydrogenase
MLINGELVDTAPRGPTAPSSASARPSSRATWARPQRAVDELEAGYTWVNAVQIAHDQLPFGGIKHSGYGKEHGTEVLDYCTEQKSVVLAGM